jgi:transposase
MQQYSADTRTCVLRALDAGMSPAAATRTFGVSSRTLRRWRQERRSSGVTAPRPRPGRTRAISRAQEPALRAQVLAHPDATLAEHSAQWAATHGVRLSPATMCRAIARLRLTVKKSP